MEVRVVVVEVVVKARVVVVEMMVVMDVTVEEVVVVVIGFSVPTWHVLTSPVLLTPLGDHTHPGQPQQPLLTCHLCSVTL